MGNNNCGCGYDGGDCCGASVKTQYCTKCKCLDPNFKEDSACPGKCGQPTYKGDGNCDDDNNNCGCGYDGGDCCGPSVETNYCKECKCIDPSYKQDSSCTGTCGVPAYKGDGNCDDENNNCGCGYDGGDCCGGKTTYCTECKCIEPDSAGTDPCGAPKYKGDGNCDDENNNSGCGYDGGDCCGSSVKTSYCQKCECLDPSYNSDSSCTGSCEFPKYKGDGNCDDENNNCGCGYDGGDCCKKTNNGKAVSTVYCKACACIDPAGK